MLNAGTATQTRPGGVHFFTADTTIRKDDKEVTITQSFILPQGQHNVTRPNDSVHVTRGYVGNDPMIMPTITLQLLILEPQCFEVTSTMEAPVFGQSRATLNPDDLFLIVQRRYDRTWHDGLWARLHEIACPTATQDRTLSIRNVCQEGVNSTR